jgi:hypothetical protein
MEGTSAALSLVGCTDSDEDGCATTGASSSNPDSSMGCVKTLALKLSYAPSLSSSDRGEEDVAASTIGGGESSGEDG